MRLLTGGLLALALTLSACDAYDTDYTPSSGDGGTYGNGDTGSSDGDTGGGDTGGTSDRDDPYGGGYLTVTDAPEG